MEISLWSRQFETAVRTLRVHQDREDSCFDVILELAGYTRDALNGSPPEHVANRLASLRECLAEAEKNGGLTLAMPVIEEMIAEVERAAQRQANRDALETIAAYMADSHGMPAHPAEAATSPVDIIMRVGDIAKDQAAAVWRALSEGLVKPVRSD